MLSRHARPRSRVQGHRSLVANLCFCVAGARPRCRQHVHYTDGNLVTHARRHRDPLHLERYGFLCFSCHQLRSLTPISLQASYLLHSVTCLVAPSFAECITGGCTASESNLLQWMAYTTSHISSRRLIPRTWVERIWSMGTLGRSPRIRQVHCDRTCNTNRVWHTRTLLIGNNRIITGSLTAPELVFQYLLVHFERTISCYYHPKVHIQDPGVAIRANTLRPDWLRDVCLDDGGAGWFGDGARQGKLHSKHQHLSHHTHMYILSTAHAKNT